MTSVENKQTKTQTPGSGVPGVGCSAFGVVVGLISNSEGSQQNGADEKKHGEHRQEIEPQGKVHVSCLLGFWRKCLLGFWRKCSRGALRSEAPNVLQCGRFPTVFGFRQLSH